VTDLPEPLQQALHALAQERPDDATGILKEYLWRDPSDAVAYALLGMALCQKGDIPSALEAIERAHYLSPFDPTILYNYGLVLESAGRTKEAQLRIAAAVRLNPDYERAWRRLAELDAGAPVRMLGGGFLNRPPMTGEPDGPALLPGQPAQRTLPAGPANGAGGMGQPAPASPGAAGPAPGPAPQAHPQPPSPAAPGQFSAPRPAVSPLQAAVTYWRSNPTNATIAAGILGVLLVALIFSLSRPAGMGNTTDRVLARAGVRRGSMAGANLAGADLKGGILSRENLAGANLEKANLAGASLETADLNKVNLSGADLSQANVRNANMPHALLIGTRLEKADLQGAFLRGADFQAANAAGANLEGAYLGSAQLGHADLSGASLRSANLTGANLVNTNLSGADLGESSLEGADLTSADLDGAVLKGARYNAATRWPKGVNPGALGAVATDAAP
jgi:uncharacterized protein YjbI with pentapeptide repeats